MKTVEIEYCGPCGLRDPAVQTHHELLETFGRDLDQGSFTTGHGGVFKVVGEDDRVFDQDAHGTEIATDALGDAVDARVSANA